MTNWVYKRYCEQHYKFESTEIFSILGKLFKVKKFLWRQDIAVTVEKVWNDHSNIQEIHVNYLISEFYNLFLLFNDRFWKLSQWSLFTFNEYQTKIVYTIKFDQTVNFATNWMWITFTLMKIALQSRLYKIISQMFLKWVQSTTTERYIYKIIHKLSQILTVRNLPTPKFPNTN